MDIAPELEPADVVTLDRVICCFDDMRALVSSSAGLAKKYYAVVFPRDNWLVKSFIGIGNAMLWLSRNPFRSFAHPTEEIEKIVNALGFTRMYYRRTLVWQVIVYSK